MEYWIIGMSGMLLTIVGVGVIACLMLKASHEKALKQIVLERKKESMPVVVPIRLQAYERVALLLERIRPESLLLRELPGDRNVAQYHTWLLTSIRNEFEHNLSQQVYISSALWEAVKNAREETVKLIHLAAGQLDDNQPGSQLASRILEMTVSVRNEPTDAALALLHQEIKEMY
ncbi:MAG: hypothetical protein J5873_00275 [Bacteroidales bacterium]|nr:hypothetical protein [Bacteroidales bacterium]